MLESEGSTSADNGVALPTVKASETLSRPTLAEIRHMTSTNASPPSNSAPKVRDPSLFAQWLGQQPIYPQVFHPQVSNSGQQLQQVHYGNPTIGFHQQQALLHPQPSHQADNAARARQTQLPYLSTTTPPTRNHALQDYQNQLMHLEGLNRDGGNAQARQEQPLRSNARALYQAQSDNSVLPLGDDGDDDDSDDDSSLCLRSQQLELCNYYKTQSFPRFQELAVELRLLIWSFLINTPRLVHIYKDARTSQLRARAPVPVVLQINHESRREALKAYALWGETKLMNHSIPSWKPIQGVFRGRTYLNCKVDIVSFGADVAGDWKLVDKVPSFPELNLVESDRVKIERVAQEAESRYWESYSISTYFSGVKEIFVTAPGYRLGKGEYGARELELADANCITSVAEDFREVWEQARKNGSCQTFRPPNIKIVDAGVWEGRKEPLGSWLYRIKIGFNILYI